MIKKISFVFILIFSFFIFQTIFLTESVYAEDFFCDVQESTCGEGGCGGSTPLSFEQCGCGSNETAACISVGDFCRVTYAVKGAPEGSGDVLVSCNSNLGCACIPQYSGSLEPCADQNDACNGLAQCCGGNSLALCGNGTCNSGENSSNCSADCTSSGPLPGVCGSATSKLYSYEITENTKCAQGNPGPTSGGITAYWTCFGLDGGTDAPCNTSLSILPPPPTLTSCTTDMCTGNTYPGYFYYPEKNQMISSYCVLAYDDCSNPTYRFNDGSQYWLRSGGKDTTACLNLQTPTPSCEQSPPQPTSASAVCDSPNQATISWTLPSPFVLANVRVNLNSAICSYPSNIDVSGISANSKTFSVTSGQPNCWWVETNGSDVPGYMSYGPGYYGSVTCGNTTTIPITVSLSASRTNMVLPTNSTNLSWTTTGSPDSCDASNFWSGTNIKNGDPVTERSGMSAGTYIFDIICHKAGTPDAISSVSVIVYPQISIIFNANPTSGPSPLTIILDWGTTGATACRATDGTSDWNTPSTKPLSGTRTVSGITVPTLFTLICNNGGGNKTSSITINPSTPDKYSVTVNKSQGGFVTSDDGGINCGATCVKLYDKNSTITLRATPMSSAWRFVGWTGSCSGGGVCTLLVDSPKSVTATFVPKPTDYREF